jgi:hypothetical protein
VPIDMTRHYWVRDLDSMVAAKRYPREWKASEVSPHDRLIYESVRKAMALGQSSSDEDVKVAHSTTQRDADRQRLLNECRKLILQHFQHRTLGVWEVRQGGKEGDGIRPAPRVDEQTSWDDLLSSSANPTWRTETTRYFGALVVGLVVDKVGFDLWLLALPEDRLTHGLLKKASPKDISNTIGELYAEYPKGEAPNVNETVRLVKDRLRQKGYSATQRQIKDAANDPELARRRRPNEGGRPPARGATEAGDTASEADARPASNAIVPGKD